MRLYFKQFQRPTIGHQTLTQTNFHSGNATECKKNDAQKLMITRNFNEYITEVVDLAVTRNKKQQETILIHVTI